MPLNARLAKLYGGAVADDAGFQPVRLDDGKRFGVLTHPYLMATFGYTSDSAPIHRGVFLARGVLGLTLRPPQGSRVSRSARTWTRSPTEARMTARWASSLRWPWSTPSASRAGRRSDRWPW